MEGTSSYRKSIFQDLTLGCTDLDKMKLDIDELKNACFEYARAVMWEMKPTDVADIQAFADLVFSAAFFHVEYISDRKSNPNFLVDCVRYMTIKHAIPPMRNDIEFVQNALDVLVELAFPNQDVTLAQKSFFNVIIQGVQKAQNDIDVFQSKGEIH